MQNDGKYSAPLPVTNQVNQSCVMVHTLFYMIFSATCDAGCPIRHRLDGKISKVQTNVLDKLINADDMADNAKNRDKMKRAMDRVSRA